MALNSLLLATLNLFFSYHVLSFTRSGRSKGLRLHIPFCQVGMVIPGHVKWPRTQVHYVQVSVGGGYSLISYAFQIDVEAGTSNSAALFSGV